MYGIILYKSKSMSVSRMICSCTLYSSLVPRPEKRAWYTLSAHASKCTEIPGTSYISPYTSLYIIK